MDYRRSSSMATPKLSRSAPHKGTNIYAAIAGATPNAGDRLPVTMWWDDERIESTVNRQFVLSKLRPDEQPRLDKPVEFGDGLTDDTYLDWIEEKAKRIFLILVDLGVPDQIFGVIDDSWDDDDLPVALDQIERLQLTFERDEKLEKKFFQRQFNYLLRNLQKGNLLFYDDAEVVPLELVDRRPVTGLSSSAVDKVSLPGRPDTVFLRRRIPLGLEDGCMSQEDFLSGIDALKAVEHEHLMSLWAAYIHQDEGYVLLTPVNDNTLKSFLTITPQSIKILSKQDRRVLLLNWLHCMADALSFLHSKGLSHGKIKPSNVMLDVDNNVFFGDSGIFNRSSTEPHRKSIDKEAYNYASPEQWQLPTTSQPQILNSLKSGRRDNVSLQSSSGDQNSSNDSSSTHPSSRSSPPSLQPSQMQPPKTDPQKSDVFSFGCVILDILTFLLKRASRSFCSHRSARHKLPGRGGAPPDSSFHKNLGQVESWIRTLAKDASKKEDRVFRGVAQILELTSRMVLLPPDERPSAQHVAGRLHRVLTEACGLDPVAVHCAADRSGADGGWSSNFANLKLGEQIGGQMKSSSAAAVGYYNYSPSSGGGGGGGGGGAFAASHASPPPHPPLLTPSSSSNSNSYSNKTGGWSGVSASASASVSHEAPDSASVVTKRSSGSRNSEGKSRTGSSSRDPGLRTRPKAKAWQAPVYAGRLFRLRPT